MISLLLHEILLSIAYGQEILILSEKFTEAFIRTYIQLNPAMAFTF